MSNIKPYDIQVVPVGPNDVIICHIDESFDFDELNIIQKEVEKVFPNNKVLVANENVLKRISIFKIEEPLKTIW